MAALTILSPGSKSDKLAGIFRLYVTSSSATSLEKYQLHCFVRCLLITLSTLAEVEPTTNDDDDDDRYVLTMWFLTDDEFLTTLIFDRCIFDRC